MASAASAGPLYLRPEAKIEPLVGRWYAWPHLISPVQAALNLVHRQIPVLRSFLANASIHLAASEDPELFAGPFVGLQKEDIPAVNELLEYCERQFASAIKLATDLKQFEQTFASQATGGHLDQIYQSLPDSLAGRIELSYDTSNRPVMRLFEELIYGGAADMASGQQLSIFVAPDEERAFFLNTPRLPSPDRLDLDVRFANQRLDTLLRMRTYSSTMAELQDDLELTPEQCERLSSFLTTEAPERRAPAYLGGDVRVRYFGHACVLLQTSDVSILFDPVVAQDRHSPEAHLTLADLPDKIDYVFLTHNHQDHFCPEILLQLRARIGRILVPRHNPANLADPSMRLALKALGFCNVDVLDPLAEIAIPGGRIISLPFYGEHADLDIQTKQGAFVELLGETFAFLADSNCLDRSLYTRLAQRFGSVSALFIGMECDGAPLSWLYGPYLGKMPNRKDDEARRLSGSDADRAWNVVEELGCRQVFVYAMGQEPWLRQLLGLAYSSDSIQILESDKFVAKCQASGLPAVRLKGCADLTILPESPH